jgi:hypothetical protein
MSLKSSTVERRLWVRTVSSTSRPSMRPEGSSTFSLASTWRTSTGVRPKEARRAGSSHSRIA